MGSVIEMKLFMALAALSPSKPFPTPGPLALEWLLFVMRTHVTYDDGSAPLQVKDNGTNLSN